MTDILAYPLCTYALEFAALAFIAFYIERAASTLKSAPKQQPVARRTA